MKAKVNLKNILAYLQGNYRYQLFYSSHGKKLLRKHIVEQIVCRINSMDIKCYTEGSCQLCGCTTTELQMADKACDKPCYPTMLSKKKWNKFKEFGIYCDEDLKVWEFKNNKFKLIK